MKQPILHLDWETRSTVDLKKTGMYVYAEHHTTDIWVGCWSLNNGPVQTWTPGMEVPYLLRRHVERGHPIYAHNAMFEKVIWDNIATPRYGWPKPKLEQFYCTASLAAAMALPRDLARACLATGLDEQKDMTGHRHMLKMARPRRVENGNIIWWDDQAQRERLYAYCRQDVRSEVALHKRLRPLRPMEREVWLLDCRINDRGVRVDGKAVRDAGVIIEHVIHTLNKELAKLTEGYVMNVNKTAKMVEWLQLQGLDIDSVAKPKLRELLGGPTLITEELTAGLKEQLYLLGNDQEAVLDVSLPPRVRRVLEIRQEAAKASTAKLKAYSIRTTRNGRMKENLMYHGASTGRWAGKGAQLQNLPRGILSPEQVNSAIELMQLRDPNILNILYQQPMTVVSSCLRGMLIPARDHRFISADFSNIEGRVLAWLADERPKVKAFRDFDKGIGDDIYVIAAAGIYVASTKAIDKKKRQVGKTAELALGYQGGVMAFYSMSVGYDVNMAEAFPGLWKLMDNERQDKLQHNYEEYVNRATKQKAEIILAWEVWAASEMTKQLWRAANPNIVRLWHDLEDSALEAVRVPGRAVECGKVVYKSVGNILWCKLPGGRCLAYMDPRVRTVKTPWGQEKETVTFMGIDSFTKKWQRQKAYGGLWAENITQAVARDLMAEAMLRVEKAGYPVVLSVHDELVSEVPKTFGSVTEYEKLMIELPVWAAGLPVQAGGWTAERYQK